MKKKLIIILVALVVIATILTLATLAAQEEAKEITISYMNTQETTSDTTSLDTKAYSGGKQIVKAGESFTLPTTANSSYVGTKGYELVWYTEDGRTYKAGESVSFTKDTKLFRCVAEQVYTMDDLNSAMTSNSKAAILMCDITTTQTISVENQGQSVLILNGYTINISSNSGAIMGSQRSGKHVYGYGTINVSSPNDSKGSYSVFECRSHSYNGNANKTVVGRDVTIDAPNHNLFRDGDQSYNIHYPWVKVYGTINVYSLYNEWHTSNRNPVIEFFEGSKTTITGSQLNTDTSKSQGIEVRIYGGTFYLPSEAAETSFWTQDTSPTINDKDSIIIMGGSFYVEGGAAPAISEYVAEQYMTITQTGGNGVHNNTNDSTYQINYHSRRAYNVVFKKYTSGAPADLVVTDYVDGSLSGTYKYTVDATGTTINSITVYEADGVTVSNKFSFKPGQNGLMVKLAQTSKDRKIVQLSANNTTYYSVVSANCTHSFSVQTENATCQHYAKSYNVCTACGEQVIISYGEKQDHAWTLQNEIPATPTSQGTKEYDCSGCANKMVVASYYDPNDLIINVGTTSGVVQAAVRDVLKLVPSEDEYIGKSYTVAGVLAFGDYEIEDIISIEIPVGISNANFILKNEYLQKITILDNANIRMTKFTNLKVLKTIEIKAATVEFVNGCSNDVITSIYSNTPGANVTFTSSVFEGDSQLTELTLSAGSEYEFGSASFKYAGVKELIVPDGCTPVFKNEGSFYGCALEYIYIGTGNEKLNGKPFDCCKHLKKVVLMDVKSFDLEWNFCVANDADNLNPLEVYIHADTISLPNNTFYFRSGITIYTNAQITNGAAFNNCKSYTIVKGIPHKLVPGSIEPTCTEHGISGYITDCPCGKGLVGEVETKIFNSVLTNSESFTTETYTSYKVDPLGHMEGEILNIEYKNGYDNMGTKTALCLRCNEVYTEEDPTANRIYLFLGYSSNKDFTELAIGFMFDVTAMETYEKTTGKAFAYGVVGAITLALDGKVPHEVQGGAVFAEFERGTSYVTYRVKGFNQELYTLGITISAYARVTKDGITEYYYIQDELPRSRKCFCRSQQFSLCSLSQ